MQARFDVDQEEHERIGGIFLDREKYVGIGEVLQLKVAHIEATTPRIRRIELSSVDGSALPAFTAGAHIDIEMPNEETRSYSLLNDCGEKHRYVLGVLREPESLGGSAYLHDKLEVGGVLTASTPSNDFPLYEAAEANILIAGGIGVTPMMSMAARLAELGRDYTLHYCARSADEAAFLDELRARHGDHLETHFDGGDPTRGLDVKALLGARRPGAHVYVCGPIGLIRDTIAAAADWPQGTVHYELFKGNAADLAFEKSDQPFDIVLKKACKTFTVPADKSILAVLRAEGFKIKTLCTTGRCGTCRVTYLSGKVDHRDDVLDDDERATVLQVCVSRAMPGETLVLDL
jgi:vanillate O-demethylase ferredoxin subunit